jgi:hypothetical protein
MKKSKTKIKFVPEFDSKTGTLKTGGIVFPIIPKVKEDGTLESIEEASQRTDYESEYKIYEHILDDNQLGKKMMEFADTGAKSKKEIKAELLKLLRTDESSVSDKEFFEYIRKRPSLLAATFAQQKIVRWRNAIRENKDNDGTARDNLLKIGNVLAFFTGHERPRTNYALIYVWRHHVYELIKGKRILNRNNPTTTKPELKEIFGQRIIDSIDVLPRTYSELADCITAQNFGLTPNTVKKYCKKVEQIDFGTDLLGFKPKNSK